MRSIHQTNFSHKYQISYVDRYAAAVANRGDYAFTGPYLDAFGSGYVVTMSKVLWKNR